MLRVLAFTVLIFLSSCKKESDSAQYKDYILIGEVGSLTGDTASFGISTHRGIELATKELNEKGGLLGKKVSIVKYDNQGKDDETATVMNRLINQHKVVAILGEVASRRSKVMAPIAQASKIPMVTPSSTNPDVTKIGDYIFRVCFIDPFQGLVMAKFAFENLKVKRVAILRDLGQDYSVGLANAFIETFNKYGGEIVIDQSYTEKDMDFKSQLTRIRSSKVDAIFVPGYYSQVGLIARQAKEMGIKVPLIGGDGWDSPKLFEIGGSALTGSYISNHYSPDDTAAIVQSFITRYKADYNEVADGLAAQGYDAANVLFDAIKRAGSTESKKIRDALAQTKDFIGVTGKISIDENRNALKPAVVLKIENNKFNYVTSVSP